MISTRFLLVVLAVAGPKARAAEPLSLAAPSPVPIVVAPGADETDRFAASELARYLQKITGRSFSVERGAAALPARALVVGQSLAEQGGQAVSGQGLGDDGFILRRVDGRVFLAGMGTRGTLYAVYAFLERLGCGWYAPNFEFYGSATGEHIPHLDDPQIGALDAVEKPSFRWRQKYIEEGETHTPARLIALADWMAKVRLNIIGCAIDYQGEGRTKWDNWREALIPELRKRGILIEVGGHGYQVFLSASRYFYQHPEWFGMDHGRRTADPRVVFSTANPSAMATYVANVKAYLESHPEIDIFDCRPPDSSHWSSAPEDVRLGTPTERQLLLVQQLAAAIKPDLPKVKVLFEAYSALIDPPKRTLHPAANTLMEFCPINRSFLGPLWDSSLPENVPYWSALQGWLNGPVDPGRVQQTYITKYLWRSLPVLVPHLISQEARRYHQMGLGGMSNYSEPGAWAALELDHYMLARCLWNAELDPDAELSAYTAGRYGAAAPGALAYLRLVEANVPRAVLIPGTHLELRQEQRYIARFRPAAGLLKRTRAAVASHPDLVLLLGKLDASRAYALNEMELRAAFLEGASTLRPNQITKIESLLAERKRLIEANATDGLMVIDDRTW